MAEAYPEVLRSPVVQAYEMGEGSYATIATPWHPGTATVKRLVAQQRREGHVRPRPKAALLHESSLARTMPTDRILTGRCDTTLGQSQSAWRPSAWSRVCQGRSVLRKVPRGADCGREERGESLPEQGRGRAFPRLPLIDNGFPRRAHQGG